MKVFIVSMGVLFYLLRGFAMAEAMVDGTNAFRLGPSHHYGAPTLTLPKLSAGNTLQVLYLGFGMTDLLTSFGIALHAVPHIYEINPILGTHPAILTYSLTLPFAFGVTSGIAAALNGRDRAIVLFLGGFGETYSLIGNLSSGLSPLFYAIPTFLIGVGVGIAAGILVYYIARAVLKHYHYYDYQPAPFVSRPWPLKGERH